MLKGFDRFPPILLSKAGVVNQFLNRCKGLLLGRPTDHLGHEPCLLMVGEVVPHAEDGEVGPQGTGVLPLNLLPATLGHEAARQERGCLQGKVRTFGGEHRGRLGFGCLSGQVEGVRVGVEIRSDLRRDVTPPVFTDLLHPAHQVVPGGLELLHRFQVGGACGDGGGQLDLVLIGLAGASAIRRGGEEEQEGCDEGADESGIHGRLYRPAGPGAKESRQESVSGGAVGGLWGSSSEP